MINIRFYTDPVTGLPHIYNHNVIEVEVEEILLNPVKIGKERKTHVMHSAKHRMDVIYRLFMFEIPSQIVYL